MKYVCKSCGYETSRRSGYIGHIETNKHKRNIKTKNIEFDDKNNESDKEIKLQQQLDEAKAQITKEREEKMYLHVKNLEMQIKLKDEQLKLKDETIKAKEESLKIHQEDKQTFKKIAEASTDTARSSSDTLNFLMNHFKNATRITDHKLMLEDDSDKYKDLYKKIGYNAKHKSLAKFVVEVIEEVYLSGKANVRPFCVTDTSRNTYWAHLKEWEKDAKGTKILENVIRPILNIIKDEAEKYAYDAPTYLEKEEDQDKRKDIEYYQRGCVEAVSQIKNKDLEDQVLNRLSKVCQLDKKNLLIGRDTGPIIEEIIDEQSQ